MDGANFVPPELTTVPQATIFDTVLEQRHTLPDDRDKTRDKTYEKNHAHKKPDLSFTRLSEE